jgi:signal peptidase II
MKKAKYGVILLIILLDQAVKAAVRNSFDVGESRDIIGNIFSFTYVQNTGAAFSMFSGMDWLLLAVPIIAIVFGVWYMEKHTDQHWTLYTALSLTIGGGLSNIIDRLVFGFVTDMFDFHFWPVFNVADIAICTGCGILVIYILKYYGKETDANK